MADFDSKLAKCPFYIRNESNRICCEGLKERTTINFVFEDSKKLKIYMDTYCNSIYPRNQKKQLHLLCNQGYPSTHPQKPLS